MNWNQQPEQPTGRTPEQVREAFRLLFGKQYVEDDADHANPSYATQNQPAPAPEINFPELENPSAALSLQQIKTEENPRICEYPALEPEYSPAKPARSPYEPNRGPRGFLSELPESIQQKIIELRQTHTRPQLIEILAKPAPEGIGYLLDDSALERFEKRRCLIEKRAEADATAAAARQLANDETATDADLSSATLRILRAAVLEYATDIQNFEALERLNDVLHKLRRADIADRRQTYLETAKTKLPEGK